MGVKNSRKLKKKRIKVGHISVKLKKKPGLKCVQLSIWTQMCLVVSYHTENCSNSEFSYNFHC